MQYTKSSDLRREVYFLSSEMGDKKFFISPRVVATDDGDTLTLDLLTLEGVYSFWATRLLTKREKELLGAANGVAEDAVLVASASPDDAKGALGTPKVYAIRLKDGWLRLTGERRPWHEQEESKAE